MEVSIGAGWQLFKEPGSGQRKFQISLEHLVASECKDDRNPNHETMSKDTRLTLRRFHWLDWGNLSVRIGNDSN